MSESMPAVEGLDFHLPKGVLMTAKSPVEDFVLYTFSKDGHVVAKAYLGNQPTFPVSNIFPSINITQKKMEHAVFTWLDHDQKNCGELIFKISPTGWPQFFQFWYAGLTDDDVQMVKRIADGVSWRGEPLKR